MKKFILFFKKSLFIFCLCGLIGLNINAQITTLFQGFDNYNGTLSSVPPGWYIEWNTSSSYYTSTNNYGLSSPSYKFGIDLDTMITESFSHSDTLSFWEKGEGASFSMYDTLTILWSPDSINWNVLTYQDNIATVGTISKFPVDYTATHLMFIFTKYVGNLAFDDVKLTYDSTTGINEFTKPISFFNIYPNPCSGKLIISNKSSLEETKATVIDILGNVMDNFKDVSLTPGKNELNLAALQNGIYFLKIHSGREYEMKKISIER